MITTPTAFFDRKYSGGSDACLVVYIVNNAGTGFLFAEHPIFPTTGSDIQGLLYDISPVTHGFDYYTCEYQPAHVIMSIANLWSKKTAAGVWHRASDFMPDGSVNGLWGQRLRIYWWAGAGQTTLTTGLLVFDGSITGMTMQGEDRLNIQADEVWDSYFKIQLPQRRATRAIFRNLPTENINKTMPLVYGDHREGMFFKGYSGFTPGIRVDTWKWVFADHVIDSFATEGRPSTATNNASYASGSSQVMWIYVPGVKSWARSYVGLTFNVNDSGRATVLIDPDTAGWDVYLYPTSATPVATGIDAANDVGSEAAFDYNENTKLSIVANSTTQAQITFEWRQDGGADTYSSGTDLTSAQAAALNDSSNNVAALPGPATALYGFDMTCSDNAGVTITSSLIEYWDGASWISLSTTVSFSVSIMRHYTSSGFQSSGGPVFGSINSMRWHLNTGRGLNVGDQAPFKIRVTFTGTGWTSQSTVVAYIHECRLVFSCKTPRDKSQIIGKKGTNYRTYVTRHPVSGQRLRHPYSYWSTRYEDVADIPSDVFGASVTGREYGAWIDDAPSTRTNGQNVGNGASSAVGIIESLLRDELGASDGDINPTSFDTLYLASDARAASINLLPGSSSSVKSIIDRIGFEHRLVLYRARGDTMKFTLVDARGRSGSAGTILPGELAEMPEVGMTQFEPRNKITFNYRKLPHDGKFFASETITDTTSTAEYGEVTEDIDLETIYNTIQMEPIKDSLIESPGFMASRARYLVTFRTKGLRWAGLELGDVFQFHDDLDDQLLCFGEAWLNREFLVYEASVLRDSTVGMEFRAISKLPADL